VGHQALEAGGQDVAGHAQALLPLLEPFHALEGVAEDQQGPRIADDLEGGGDGAAFIGVVSGAAHHAKVKPSAGECKGCFCRPTAVGFL
jgi:hypothetical protein